MTLDDAKILIDTDDNFVYSKRYNFNLIELQARYPDGCPDRIIANTLLMTEEEVNELYETIVIKLRNAMGVEL